MMRVFKVLSVVLLALPMACSSAPEVLPKPELVSQDRGALPVMRWDHRFEAAIWTRTALGAAMSGPLTSIVPDDIAAWCPAYPQNSADTRAAFWVGLLSAMAKHESTWNPDAVGGGGQWFGLVQISPATAQGYGCMATSGAALKDGSANLSCAIAIIGQTVSRDGVVAEGRGGVAADWGPFRNDEKRSDMAAWVSAQSYCR